MHFILFIVQPERNSVTVALEGIRQKLKDRKGVYRYNEIYEERQFSRAGSEGISKGSRILLLFPRCF